MSAARPPCRAGGLTLAGLLSLTNATFAVLLIGDLAHGGGTKSAAALLLAGGALWTANVLIFALWYWAKLMMMLQSAISVAAIALVIARAVNILG